MTKINGIDYSAWTNKQAVQIAANIDKDGVKGLHGKEIFDFAKAAKNSNIEKEEVFELLGLKIVQNRASASNTKEHDPEFYQAVEFYNKNMDSRERYSVTQKAENNITASLAKMEQDINKAYIDCAAFNDPNIMVVRVSPYRHYPYPRWYDRLLKFDIEDLRTRTTKDMESLNEIRDKVEHIIKEAGNNTDYEEQQKTEYNVDEIAKKHFDGMTYQEFAAKYPKELEKCKYVTAADLHNMDSTMAYVYGRAKSYAAEMLDITLAEAHNVHWDIQERKLYESLDASGDIYIISEFEYDGITPEGLAQFKSGISQNAFENALMDKYRELNPETSVDEVSTSGKLQKPKKVVVNGAVLIFNPDGTVYDLNGQRIK